LFVIIAAITLLYMFLGRVGIASRGE
jgi:hypothetical protein